jgi:hypothetical protein
MTNVLNFDPRANIWDAMKPQKPMTVADLMSHLESIQDKSTPVYLETGKPVHYTTHGMSENENKFFIGVL